MKVADFITQQKDLLKTMCRNGISADASKWMPLYNDYKSLLDQGNQKLYCYAKVAELHGCKERWVRAVVKFMEREVT